MPQERELPLPQRRRRGARRAEDLPVRSWLKLGAASAGLGAALLGFALAGPSPVAEADTGTETSVSTGPEKATAEQSGSGEADAPDDAKDEANEDSDELDDADVTDDVDATDVDDADEADATDDAGATDADHADATDDADDAVGEATDDDRDDEDGEAAAGDADPAADGDLEADLPALVESPPPTENSSATTDSAASAELATPKRPWRELVAGFIDDWTADTEAWIDSLDASDQTKERLEATFWAVRRTFFNQAPTVDPVQITGVITGPVTGTLGAVDPDGDRVVYRLVRAPGQGSVKVNSDGTFTYTPGSDFDGVDTFRVLAVDVGMHVNVLDWFRPWGTRATPLINQGAVTFDFRYETGAGHWSAERKAALLGAANELVSYLRVNAPVVISYRVDGFDDPTSALLAQAGSSYTSAEPGFWPTLVQNKLISGGDANGSAADGLIQVNFGKKWSLDDTVESDEFDFMMALMHEMLHSFGILFAVRPGETTRRYWSTYASLVVDENGSSPFNSDFSWNTAYDPNLTRKDGGLFFGGTEAVEAYDGALIPLFTSDPWLGTSVGAHLDDMVFIGVDRKMMNASTTPGPGVRVLSAIELGILKDLGYQVVARAPVEDLA